MRGGGWNEHKHEWVWKSGVRELRDFLPEGPHFLQEELKSSTECMWSGGRGGRKEEELKV